MFWSDVTLPLAIEVLKRTVPLSFGDDNGWLKTLMVDTLWQTRKWCSKIFGSSERLESLVALSSREYSTNYQLLTSHDDWCPRHFDFHSSKLAICRPIPCLSSDVIEARMCLSVWECLVQVKSPTFREYLQLPGSFSSFPWTNFKSRAFHAATKRRVCSGSEGRYYCCFQNADSNFSNHLRP